MKKFLMVCGNAARDAMLERGFRLVTQSIDDENPFFWFENRIDFDFTELSGIQIMHTNKLFE